MKILIAGASGLIGSSLVKYLSERGMRADRLVRSGEQSGEGAVYWNPSDGEVNQSDLEGYDAVINLCGDSIFSGRWTAGKKCRIMDSRVQSTHFLSAQLAQLFQKPAVLINSSAIGFYGDRGGELLKEDSSPGNNFLSDVCQRWERATLPAEEAGIRVVRLRTGVVLSPKGGALKTMLFPFKLGLGGRIGRGDQYMSWVSLEEMIRIIGYCLNEQIYGSVNAVSPSPVNNREFTEQLAKALRRPGIFPLPAVAVRLLFGQMGDELLLSSARVHPEKLKKAGYTFIHPSLDTYFGEVASEL